MIVLPLWKAPLLCRHPLPPAVAQFHCRPLWTTLLAGTASLPPLHQTEPVNCRPYRSHSANRRSRRRKSPPCCSGPGSSVRESGLRGSWRSIWGGSDCGKRTRSFGSIPSGPQHPPWGIRIRNYYWPEDHSDDVWCSGAVRFEVTRSRRISWVRSFWAKYDWRLTRARPRE